MNISARTGLDPASSTWWDFGEVPNLRPMYVALTPRPPELQIRESGFGILNQYLWLVSWYFEPSQPQRITSGLKQTSICLLFTHLVIYSSHESSNHKFPLKKKRSKNQPWHNFTYNKTNTKHQTQNFRRISPFGIASVKKAHKARTRWYRGRRFINTRFKKKKYFKKRNGPEAIKNVKIL